MIIIIVNAYFGVLLPQSIKHHLCPGVNAEPGNTDELMKSEGETQGRIKKLNTGEHRNRWEKDRPEV